MIEICKDCGVVSGITATFDGAQWALCEKCGRELREI